MATDSTSTFFEAALGLDAEDRAELALRLIESLEPPGGLNEDNAGFVAELERRSAAYEAGTTTASTWDEASARIKSALEARQTR